MSRRLTSFALPLSFMLLFLAAESSLAATPTTTFGVMATVEAACSVSAPTFHGNYSAAMENAASSVSINCTNIAQYVIKVSSLKVQDTSMTVPVGNLSFPSASLRNYAVPLGFPRDIKTNLMAAGADGRIAQPQLAYGETTDKPARGSIQNPDTISVAITY